MKLYAVVDQKSACAEYFIASCDEDAVRIWFVMAVSSRPMYEFLEDYVLEEVCVLPQSRNLQADKQIIFGGAELKRRIDAKRKEQENAKD